MTHKLTYTHSKSSISTTIEVDEDATVYKLIEAFELYLKACEYNIDGKTLELVYNSNYLKSND